METNLFGKWESGNIAVSDAGLRKYINLKNPAVHSFSTHAAKQFGKTKYGVVERLAKKIMVTGHLKDSRVHKRVSGRDTGKKQTALRAVERALENIEKRTKQNPLQTLVRAIENAAPCEETTRIRQGGIIVHRPVDVSPQRRVDVALSFIAHGAGQRAFNKKMSLAKALAEELTAAAGGDNKTYSVARKEELERVAASAR